MVSREVIKSLKLPNVFDKGIGALLPEGYKNFYKEWRVLQPQPVHYVPEEGNWKKNEVTGEMLPIQNIPIPVKYPLEYNSQMWGGDGVIQGFQIRDKYQRRVPHFWIPLLRRSVVYSEVLDKHISVILTERTINLINAHYGFDHYLLKTFACDLKSLLPLRLKRKILQELENGCPTYEGNSEKRNKILEKYEKYLSTFTSEDINWYGYTFNEACKKYQAILDSQKEVVPLKLVYRKELIAKLVEQSKAKESEKPEESTSMSWLKKINPFEPKTST